MKPQDFTTPTGQTFNTEYQGRTASKIVQTSELPSHELFSRPYCYNRVWTAHHIIDGNRGRSGSFPMVITQRLAHELRKHYK